MTDSSGNPSIIQTNEMPARPDIHKSSGIFDSEPKFTNKSEIMAAQRILSANEIKEVNANILMKAEKRSANSKTATMINSVAKTGRDLFNNSI